MLLKLENDGIIFLTVEYVDDEGTSIWIIIFQQGSNNLLQSL